LENSTSEAPSRSSRLANGLIKVLLFVGLYLLAVLFVSTFPFPMTLERLQWWSTFSAKFGFSDPADSWVSVTLALDLIVTVFVYIAVVKLWNRSQARHRENRRT
jgi:hypothetical protein